MVAEFGKVDVNEAVQEALALLLENYWVVREEQPESYNLIRQYEPQLRSYFLEKCSWRLIQNPQFYKLEKIPAQPEQWMGIQAFQQPRDYALLCCLLAYLEEKSVEEQFLLSDLCENILALYPHEKNAGGNLNWESYEYRRSLVRVLKFAVECGIVRLVDGDSEQFALRPDSEALYEGTLLARYFLRSYPKDLHQYKSIGDLQSAEFFDEEATVGLGRRARIYRQLLLTPCYNALKARPEDFLYLRNMHRRLRDELEKYTGLQFELYKDCAMLTSPERTSWCKQVFPFHQSGIHTVILHFARLCRQLLAEGMALSDGLSPVEVEQLAGKCREQYGSGWTKEYREMSISKLALNLVEELAAWNLADRDVETGFVYFRSVLGRWIGRYPEHYMPKADQKNADNQSEV